MLQSLFTCVSADGVDDDDRPRETPLRISVDLRRRLGHGSTLNLRLLVRGDLQSGKTSLFRRMQGMPFVPDLSPTSQLGIGHIDWTPEWCEDRVKVEVWDVVDAATVQRSHGLITRANSVPETPSSPGRDAAAALDASAVDVYRDAHAMILLIDQRKRWTLGASLRPSAALSASLCPV